MFCLTKPIKSFRNRVPYSVWQHTSFLLPLFQEGQLSVTRESMCTKIYEVCARRYTIWLTYTKLYSSLIIYDLQDLRSYTQFPTFYFDPAKKTEHNRCDGTSSYSVTVLFLDSLITAYGYHIRTQMENVHFFYKSRINLVSDITLIIFFCV